MPPRSSPFRRRWWLIPVLAMVLLSGYVGWRHFYRQRCRTGRGRRNTVAVPVTFAPVQKADFPVYLNGLGTVEPYQTVTVRSRVDGADHQGRLQTGPDGQGRRYSRRDRSAALSGGARSGAREEGAGRGEPQECAAQPAALQQSRQGGIRFASAARHAAGTVDQLIAQIKGDQAAIDNAQTQVSYTTIRSPLAGKTGFRLVDPGNIVHARATRQAS